MKKTARTCDFVPLRRLPVGRKMAWHGPSREGFDLLELGQYDKWRDGWPIRINGQRIVWVDIYGLGRLANELRRAHRAIPNGYRPARLGQLELSINEKPKARRSGASAAR